MTTKSSLLPAEEISSIAEGVAVPIPTFDPIVGSVNVPSSSTRI